MKRAILASFAAAIFIALTDCSKKPSTGIGTPVNLEGIEKVIARGSGFQPKDYLEKGKIVILEFFADW